MLWHSIIIMDDNFFMQEALTLARLAADKGETPVGAVVVRNSDGKIVGSGYNMRETNRNAVHHAEILAIEDACKTLGGWRLHGCTLYVTLEPCPMCAGAIINSRIDRVVFGAYDLKAGSCGSIVNLYELGYNHKPTALGGVLRTECEDILREFFKELRERGKESNMKLIPAATDEQIKNVAAMADLIWHEWFPKIISGGQIDYMIDKFQSVHAITEQIRNLGYYYYIMHKNGVYIGYCAIHPQNDGRLFLSKIYIKKEYRGNGYSRKTFDFLREFCSKNDLNAIWLTVNKKNENSIAFYKKLGFVIIGEGVTDIGGGYSMDDYFLELKL